ncbi:Imm1 family immunity protein [Actinokineospora sp.]|uniref:Imm1 family immunity protein n=1 Tax=Actinokineospora sp. TaxID=1872133 RepID=UPI0040377532
MVDHVVTARGSSVVYPHIVAGEPIQREMLVDLALHDPGLSGIYARSHFNTCFYTWDRPVGMGNGAPHQCLQAGYFAKFGGLLFTHDPRDPGDNSATDEDWAWLAVRARPLADVPAVYFDQESGILFPPRCVLPMNELREVVLEFVHTGERPASVEWLTVNDFRWKLDGAGDIASGNMTCQLGGNKTPRSDFGVS